MFKSFEDLSDWIWARGRWYMLTSLRDAWGWHRQRNVGFIFLSLAWVLLLMAPPSPCREPPYQPVCPQSRAQPLRTLSFSIAPLRSRSGAGTAPSPVVGSALQAPWQPGCLPAVPAGMAGSSAESLANAPWSGDTAELQLAACGLDLTRGGAWLCAFSLERMGNRSLGTATPLLLICSSWRPGLGNWKKHKTFLSLEGIHSSILGLGSSPRSLFQCLWGSYLY